MEKKILIFDLDDTIVLCNHLYLNAKNKFLNIMKNEFDLGDEEVKKIENEFKNLDILRVKVFGSGKFRYFESMLLIYFSMCIKYSKKFSTRIELKIKSFTLLNNALIDVDIFPESIQILKQLKNEGYHLFCFTAGDEDWQMFKIKKFKLKDYFHKIYIENFKTDLEYQKITMEINGSKEINYSDFIMIGNSFKSDILPSNSLGMYSIYLQRLEELDIHDTYKDAYYKINKDKLTHPENNYIIHNLNEIFDVLKIIEDK